MSRRVALPRLRPGAALAWVLVLGTGAQAQDPGAVPASAPPQEEAPPPPAEPPPTPEPPGTSPLGGLRLGVLLDVGAPDGIGVSAVVRPVQWLRLNAGVTTNTLSLGVRGGLSLVPLSTLVSPSLNADFGHYFDADYNKLVDRLGNLPLRSQAPIQDVGYNYAGASVGLEVGRPERFAFSLRAGLSYGSLTIDDTEKLLREVTGDPELTARPLTLRFSTPSLKLGFLLYFF